MNNVVRRHTKAAYKRCAFTGYRPAKMPFGYDESDPRCVKLKERLHDMIKDLIGKGYAHFLSGGARADVFAAEAVLDLKKDFPWILLEMTIPFDGQADRWDAAYQARHARLLNEADIVTVISHAYTKSCFFLRNRYLVTNCDTLVAVYDGQPGGTAMTVEYARECGREILYIRPCELGRAKAS